MQQAVRKVPKYEAKITPHLDTFHAVTTNATQKSGRVYFQNKER